MKMLTIVFCFFLHYASWLIAGESELDAINRQLHGSASEFASVIRAERTRHAVMERELINLVASSKDDNIRKIAADVLGEFRSSAAVDVLTNNLVDVQSKVVSGPGLTPHIGVYPSALALVNIGTPSVKSLLELLEKTNNDVEREVATYTLREILGFEDSIKQFQRRMAANSKPEVKRNMQWAIEEIQREQN